MRKILLLLLSISFLSSGCFSYIASSLLGISEPVEESKEEQIKYLSRKGIDIENLLLMKDSSAKLLRTLPYKSGYKPGFKPIQFKLFDKNGFLIAQYANCEGPFDAFTKNFPPNPPICDSLIQIEDDIKMYNDINGKDIDVREYFKNNDYVLIVYWAKYMGKLSLNLLNSVEKYVSQYPDKKIVVVKVNIGNIPNK